MTHADMGQWMLSLVDWAREAGAIGAVGYGLLYVVATVVFFPGSVLTFAAGFLYGPGWGVLVVVPASVIGATLAFWLGRTVARDWISSRVAGHPRFALMDEAVGRNGFRIVFLLRLSPFAPFNVLNYALGLTRVRLASFVSASLLGMIPGAFLYVYIGSLITNVTEILTPDRSAAGPAGSAFYVAGLAATVAVSVLLTRIARRALDDALAEARTSA